MKWSIRALVATGLLVIAAMFTIPASTHGGKKSADAANAGNAAFRDGAYQGRLAVQRGERPHLTAARWSHDHDRRAYVAGYQQAYLQALGQNGIMVPQGIEEAGYRDGLQDGARDRQSTHLFRNVGRVLDHGNLRLHEAYPDGCRT